MCVCVCVCADIIIRYDFLKRLKLVVTAAQEYMK